MFKKAASVSLNYEKLLAKPVQVFPKGSRPPLVWTKDWTLAEDRFLIWSYEYELDDARLTDVKVLLEYRKKAKVSPKSFCKQDATPDVLRKRWQHLKTNDLVRYTLLKSDIEQERQSAEEEAKTKAEEEEKKRTRGRGKRSPHRERPPLLKMTEIHFYQADTGDAVVMNTPLDPLVKTCEYFAESVERAGTASGTVIDMTRLQRDLEQRFPLHNCFDRAVFQKLIAFCSAPDVLQELEDLDKNVTIMEEEFTNRMDTLRTEYTGRIKLFTAELQRLHDDLEQKTKDDLEQQLQEDLATLRASHQRQVEICVGQIDHMYQSAELEMQQFFAKEFELIQTQTAKQTDLKRLHLIETQANKRALFEDVFHEGKLPQLLLLAQAVRSEQLRNTAIEVLVRDFHKLKGRDALTSNFIDDRLRKLVLSKISPENLMEACNTNTFLTKTYSNREMQYRKKLLADHYLTLTNDTLRAFYHDNSQPFPDVVEAEIQRRARSLPPTTLNPACSPSHLIIIDRLTATVNRPKRYATVHATQARDSTKDGGRWYWEVRIDKLDELSSIYIGFDVPRDSLNDLDAIIPGLTTEVGGDFGCAWQNDGTMYSEGESQYINEPYKQGDIIGCALNMLRGHKKMSFYKNGKEVALGYIHIQAASCPFSALTKICVRFAPITRSQFERIPSVTLYGASASAPYPQVTFNFNGPFIHPAPKDFDAYSFGLKVEQAGYIQEGHQPLLRTTISEGVVEPLEIGTTTIGSPSTPLSPVPAFARRPSMNWSADRRKSSLSGTPLLERRGSQATIAIERKLSRQGTLSPTAARSASPPQERPITPENPLLSKLKSQMLVRRNSVL